MSNGISIARSANITLGRNRTFIKRIAEINACTLGLAQATSISSSLSRRSAGHRRSKNVVMKSVILIFVTQYRGRFQTKIFVALYTGNVRISLLVENHDENEWREKVQTVRYIRSPVNAFLTPRRILRFLCDHEDYYNKYSH
jgi:hypothetical protein